MAKEINLNADMGEGFGAYDIGDDAGLLKIIRSASIACGFHAGDPVTMQRLVTEAAAQGVSIGAHPGFNDLWGFGRRRIDMDPRELEFMIAYQIGALQSGAGGGQWIIVHHQRAKRRDGLDDAFRSARPEARIETQDIIAERPVDAVAELDDEGTVPGGEEAHLHRFPW